MVNDDFSINFSGITHDHTVLDSPFSSDDDNRSTIAILRRHPMYDCLVLVKKYRNCLRGYALEFPSENVREGTDEMMSRESSQVDLANQIDSKIKDHSIKSEGEIISCRRRQLVSRFLDGDDPIYQLPCTAQSGLQEHLPSVDNLEQSKRPFAIQYDDQGSICDLVHVPINGLLDRLKNYNESGIAVDSRVYAFAMGLKTSERILTTNSMKELQETPI